MSTFFFCFCQSLKKGTQLLKITHGKFRKKKTTWKMARLNDDHTKVCDGGGVGVRMNTDDQRKRTLEEHRET